MNRVVFSVAVLVAMAVTAGGLYLLTRTSAPEPAVSESPRSEAEPGGTPSPRAGEAAPADATTDAAPRPPRAFVPPRVPEPVAPPADPTTGTLRIDSDVPGAQVFIDRNFIGIVPVTVRDLPPGTHRLNLDAPGYDGVLQMIEVEPGPAELFVSLRQVSLDVSIPVVHEHRLGSCRGQLSATASGIRYVPVDGDDGFSAPLTDLERFDVDYAEKRLRLQLRGGRRYDFSDSEDNADRLFVFHRDVDRARARLAGGGSPDGP